MQSQDINQQQPQQHRNRSDPHLIPETNSIEFKNSMLIRTITRTKSSAETHGIVTTLEFNV